MKRKITAIFLVVALALSLGLVPAAPAAAHLEGAPFTTELLAGQDIDVGTVSVWNDSDNLYVKYDTTGGWEITETHLYVGQTNPNTLTCAPGQFPYDDADAASVTDTEVTYEIPLAGIDGYHMQLNKNKKGKPTGVMVADGDPGVTPCNDIYIAAHAGVQKCVVESFEFVPELTWQRSSEEAVAVHPGYGAQWTYAEGFAITTDSVPLVWDGGDVVGQYFTGYSTRSDISWASWVCTQNPSGKSTTGTDLRRFQATFDIPAGYSVTGGTLGSVNPGYENVIPMNDNIYIFVNEELIFWGGTISIPQLDPTRTHFLGIERRDTEPQNKAAFPETDGWHMDGAIPAISSSLFVEGPNVLDVFAEELWTGGGMHELGLTLQVEQTTCETETAWGDGARFTPKGNWATYIEYHVQAYDLVDNGNATAEWSDDTPNSGTYSAKITMPNTWAAGDYAWVEIPVDIALQDLDTLQFYLKVIQQASSQAWATVTLGIDADEDGDYEHVDIDYFINGLGLPSGSEDDFLSIDILSTFGSWTLVDALSHGCWLGSTGLGVYHADFSTFTGQLSNNNVELTDHVKVIKIFFGGSSNFDNEIAYVDDIIYDTTTVALEP